MTFFSFPVLLSYLSLSLSLSPLPHSHSSGFPLMAHTGAARAAVDNLTKTLAVEWAASGVRVNSVAPGVIFSPTAAANYERVKPTLFQDAVESIPARRCGTPEEVSAAVCWLLSPAASFVSGATLRVDAASSLNTNGLVRVPPHENWPPPPLLDGVAL